MPAPSLRRPWPRFFMRSPPGYTGAHPRLVMLNNSSFVDAKVRIFGRHGSRNWVRMGEYEIERRLVTD